MNRVRAVLLTYMLPLIAALAVGWWMDRKKSAAKYEAYHRKAEFVWKMILMGNSPYKPGDNHPPSIEEWYEDIREEGGWIAFINFRDHVLKEMKQVHLQNFVLCGEQFSDVNWRSVKPFHFHHLVESRMLSESA